MLSPLSDVLANITLAHCNAVGRGHPLHQLSMEINSGGGVAAARAWLGAKRLSKEFGCARNTVRRYLREGGAAPFKKPVRGSAFDGLDDWLRERFFRHDGNADVIRQELASEHGVVIGLRSVELRVRQWRRELKVQKRATVRFETPPGRQLQIDFNQVYLLDREAL
jgi:transposase